jgi:hypothetical protein
MSDDDFEAHLRIITSSGERTRGIIYFYMLISATIFALFVEADLFPWALVRNEHVSKALLCYSQGLGDTQSVPGGDAADLCQRHYNWMEAYYIVEQHNSESGKPTISPITADALLERYKQTLRAAVDSSEVTLPIISIRMDVGNIFIFSSIALTIILVGLRMSMLNEYQCIKTVKDLGVLNTRSKNLMVMNSHVFASPRNSIWFWWFLYIPILIVGYDIIFSLIAYLYSFTASISIDHLTLYCSAGAICLLIVTAASVSCHKAAKALDDALRTLEKSDQTLAFQVDAA